MENRESRIAIRSVAMEETSTEIETRFTYHKPTETQARRYEEIRGEAKALAVLLNGYCPPSRELSLALTHLEETVMWANAAIARRS